MNPDHSSILPRTQQFCVLGQSFSNCAHCETVSACPHPPLPRSHTSREIVVGSEKCVAISCLAAQREEEAITRTRSLQRDFKDWVLPAFCNFMGAGSPSFTWNFVRPLQALLLPKKHQRNQWCHSMFSSGDSDYLVSPPVKLPVRLVFLQLNFVCLSAAEGVMVFAQTCQILIRNLNLIGQKDESYAIIQAKI